MHIFKYVSIFIGMVFAQNKGIQVLTIDSTQITSSLDSLLNKQSSLTIEYRLKSYDIEENISNYYMVDSFKNADSLILLSDNKLKGQVVNQILRPFIKLPIGKQYHKVGKDLVSKYYFINETPSVQFGLLDKQSLVALILLKPNFNSLFAGAFGLSQINNEFKVVGELDIDIENFTGNAEQIKILWKKNKSLSQKIKLSTFVPYLFGTAIGSFWQYKFENHNGFYTKNENKIMFHTFLPLLNSFQVGYSEGKILSTKLGKDAGYKDGDFYAISLISNLDTRDDRLLPLSGQLFNIVVDSGIDKKSRFIKTELKYQLFLSIFNNSYAKLQTVIRGINYSKGLVPKSRYFNLGGASSLRGFNEQAFSFSQYQILTLELINQQKAPLQIKSFIDLGSNKFNLIEKYLFGYGVGIKQVNDKSIVSLEYSLGSDNLKSGKIHIKWSARL